MCFRLVVLLCALAWAGGTVLSQESVDRDDALAPIHERTEYIFEQTAVQTPLPVWDEATDAGSAPAFAPGAGSDAGQTHAPPLMTNDDVLAMVDAQFSEALIKAAMNANTAAFDVSPRALVTLKNTGVSEAIIEAMLAAETARRQALASPAVSPATDGPIEHALEVPAQAFSRDSPEEFAGAAPIDEDLPSSSAGDDPTAATRDPPAGPGPHAWLAEDLTILTPTIAQVAFIEAKGTGSRALKTLDSLDGRKALVFATPALAVANEIRGLFRSDDPMRTAVWALPGAAATQTLTAAVELEIEFDKIPGVNPDQYRPAVVQLVPTIDNYRLVGAAKTRLGDLDAGLPTEAIVEEPVAAEIVRLERGRYRVTLADLVPGEYALVLRPIELQQSKLDTPTSLRGLLGTGSVNLLYLTWDFSVVG